MSVVIETTIGDFTVDLYVKERPRSTMNFLKLCKIKYYNLQLFYKVTPNFICQAGDPTASGRGGDSIFRFMYGDQARFFEVEKQPKLKHLKLGTFSMVDNGDGMLGSQFLITLSDNLDYLDDQHCVIGEVVEGFEFLERINNAICDKDERPFQDIRITHTVILDDPFDEPAELEYPPSPEVTLESIKSDRIGCYEVVDDTEGKTMQELEEEMKDKEAKAQATILEIIGDLPDADMAPPENVLFVCKLNPVTSDDDLELIFSRFGEIKSCEVIRDWKTGESLQYAFIEFAQQESCEQAYFKMDNVLIDDRRIHVDFSQSVAKVKWKGKGRGVVGSWSDDKKENQKTAGDRTREKYRIKDSRKQDGYQLILENDDDEHGKRDERKRSRERIHSSGRRRSRSAERRSRNVSPKRRRSRSSERYSQKRHRSRDRFEKSKRSSRSPVRRRSKERRRSISEGRRSNSKGRRSPARSRRSPRGRRTPPRSHRSRSRSRESRRHKDRYENSSSKSSRDYKSDTHRRDHR